MTLKLAVWALLSLRPSVCKLFLICADPRVKVNSKVFGGSETVWAHNPVLRIVYLTPTKLLPSGHNEVISPLG